VSLWIDVLQFVRPKLFISADKKTHSEIESLISNAYNLPVSSREYFPINWGKYSAELSLFGADAEIALLRIPHPSRFQIWCKPKYRRAIDTMLSAACAAFDRKSNTN
jgi:hypothetical protein